MINHSLRVTVIFLLHHNRQIILTCRHQRDRNLNVSQTFS
jgi:hypothetical protein